MESPRRQNHAVTGTVVNNESGSPALEVDSAWFVRK